MHLSICIFSLAPFVFSGDRRFALVPLSLWLFYHVLFIVGPRQANLVVPGFGRFKNTFKTTIEEFFSPKLLPVLSISFVLVTLSLAVTGHRLGGPPLCYHSCQVCLSQWSASIPLVADTAAAAEGEALGRWLAAGADRPLSGQTHHLHHAHDSSPLAPHEPYFRLVPARQAELFDPAHHYGCGFANGKELLGFYTMAQTSFLLFLSVVVAMAVCLAWRVAEDEREDYSAAEEMLKKQSPGAYELRSELLQHCGNPASPIRPEGSFVWVVFGVVAALSFTLLGWHNWSVLSPSPTSTLLIVLNLLTILMTTLILHLGFFGRILALYMRNYRRVSYLTQLLTRIERQEVELDHWWNCRTFVLNDDLSLDYDAGGLAVSATFVITVLVFLILLAQVWREGGGYSAMLEPPGSYCAYASMYITCCLIKIFTLATNTYEEQHRHIQVLQSLSSSAGLRLLLMPQAASPSALSPGGSGALGLFIDDDAFGSPRQTHVPLGARRGGFGVGFSLSGSSDDGPLPANDDADAARTLRVSFDVHDADGDAAHSVGLSLSPTRHAAKQPLQPPLGGVDLSSGAGLFENLMKRSQFLSPTLPHAAFGRAKAAGPRGGGTAASLRALDLASTSHDVAPPAAPLHSDAALDDDVERQLSAADGEPPHAAVWKLSRRVLTPALPASASHSKLSALDPATAAAATTTAAPLEAAPASSSAAVTTTSSQSASSPSSETLAGGDDDNDDDNAASRVTLPPSMAAPPSIPRPTMLRSVSSSVEHYRLSIAEFIVQIRKYDPYPCILGIPVMPALFSTSKFYIFISFVLLGSRTMLSCWRNL